MIITHKLNMDLGRRGIIPPVNVVQDDKYSRNLEITLASGGVSWNPPAGTGVVVRYTKPDGKGGIYNTLPDGTLAGSVDGNVVTVALAPQVCTVPGVVLLTVGLVSGASELHSFVIEIIVQRNPGINVESEDYTSIQIFPLFANSIAECTDTSKLYVLPDGYIYAYMQNANVPLFTNQLKNAVDTDGTSFNNGRGYEYGYLNSTGTIEENQSVFYSGFIPYNGERIIRISGLPTAIKSVELNGKLEFVESDRTTSVYGQWEHIYLNEGSMTFSTDGKDGSGLLTFDLDKFTELHSWWSGEIKSRAKYIRVSWRSGSTVENAIVTLDEEITWGIESKWQSTGHQFIPADNEDRIIVLENAKENHESRITELELYGGGSGSSEDIPIYIKTEADDVISRLVEKQGDRCFTMIGLSDIHYGGTGDNKDNLIRACKAISYIQGRIHVDAVATLGDNVPFGAGGDENMKTAHRWFREINEILKMTEGEGVAMFRTPGNHDRLGGLDGEGNATSFMPDDAMYRYIGGYNRGCVMGDVPGGWGYQDFESYKLRVIVLNTAETEGVGRFSEYAGYRISTKQYNWLIDTLDMSGKADATDWQILILSHHRPDDWQEFITETTWGENGYILPNILHAYRTGSAFTGTRPGGDIISCDFSGKNQAVLIGSIHGHRHDYKYGNLYRGPETNSNLTDVLAVGTPTTGFGTGLNEDNEGNLYDSVKNTAEETAFCVYSIDLDNRVIHAIHYGNGIDREIHYSYPAVAPAEVGETTTETWTFELKDGSTVTKQVVVMV